MQNEFDDEMPETAGATALRTGDDRHAARRRLEKKRAWTSGLVAYLVVNSFLIGVWALTGRGYFWPVWVLGGWGLGVVLSFWDTFVRKPITEADVDAEIRRS
ncbi:2TM domain-containing protein [Kineosporia sp. A_224]|uniref:2TM domain-containing protein n=1 Tax=Kineosporia sp. A_224 TaxID=1962180 RepID=UPI0018E9C846|nr:2TM domain-containing protein [Kineosporia sp. A_224]